MRAYSVVHGGVVVAALSALGGLSGAAFLGCGSGEPVTIDGTKNEGSDAGTDAETDAEIDAGADAEADAETDGGPTLKCVVDGKVSDTEQCDDGNAIDGDGCDNDCTFTCVGATPSGDAQCDDTDPCNGAETCTKEHTCMSGAGSPDGTSCGAGKVCKTGVCGDVTCGDGFTSPPSEECDDANLADGDGCDSCKFTCLSIDPTRDCSGGDPCAGASICDDAAHICSQGAPLADGTACGASAFCLGGVCTAAICGNSAVEPGEACDDGNPIDGDGCDADCTLSCVNPAADCAAPPACQKATCSAANTCALTADAALDNTSCGVNLVCKSGACIGAAAVCGNGAVESGEQCDFGAANGPGTGCEASCLFSCTMVPDSCPDADVCNGAEACSAVMVGGKAGQKCSAGAALANCSACAGGLCVSGACKISSCGDGCVDAGLGEQCEPPGSATCDATCKAIVAAVCGDGVRNPGEQCDDGNTTNLDGCDGACLFEQSQRATWLTMQFTTDAFCTSNKLGAAIVGGGAQTQLQTSIDSGIANGSTTVIFKSIGLDDLTGTFDPSLELGTLTGGPETMMGMLMYDGTNDLDWWHNISAASIDANRDPVNKLPASIVAKVLTAGPGTMDVPLILANGAVSQLHMSNVNLTIAVNATSAPTASAGGPPGHLASEQLDPALMSYSSCGQKTANGGGKLCGNTSASSLSQVPIPASLTGGGLFACSENYAVTNSMLDVIVNGCTIFAMPQIAKTQPDTVDLAVPPAGAGGPYTLSVNAQKVVSTCKDKTNATVPLAACLKAAAYSSYFKFATGRVIAK